MAWHHVLGLVGGITILTWVFSGWFSMGPNKWLSYQTPSTLPARFAQAQPVFLHRLESLQQMAASNQAVKAIEAGWYDGHPVWTLFDGAGSRRTVDAISGESISVRREALLKPRRRRIHLPGLKMQGFSRKPTFTGTAAMQHRYFLSGASSWPILRLPGFTLMQCPAACWRPAPATPACADGFLMACTVLISRFS